MISLSRKYALNEPGDVNTCVAYREEVEHAPMTSCKYYHSKCLHIVFLCGLMIFWEYFTFCKESVMFEGLLCRNYTGEPSRVCSIMHERSGAGRILSTAY